jgi:uncharacterized protein YcbX
MELAEVVGQLAGLRRFPVRALGGEEPDEVLMQGSTMAGDRIYDLVDEEQGTTLTAATTPRLLRYRARYLDAMVRGEDLASWIRVALPDGREFPLTERSWVEDVSRRCLRPVRLRVRANVESDPAPLQVLSVQTVRFFEAQYGAPLEGMRLRSNLLLDLPDGRAFEEDRWIGRSIWVGDALLEIVRPCDRCLVTTLDAETPERSPGILNAIVRGRRGLTGVLARALTGNRLRVGDPVALVD